MAKGKSILRLVVLALSMLAMGPQARGGDCASAGAAHPHGDPWGGGIKCSTATCSTGTCSMTFTNPSPGVFLVFCSCDGVHPQACCHIVVTLDTGAGTATYAGEGACGGSCPAGDQCAAQHTVSYSEQGMIDHYSPACG